MTVVRTERLLLRPLEPDDLAALAPIWADPRVMQHIGTGQVLSFDESRDLLDRLTAHWDEHGFGLWAVVPAGESAPVGWAGLSVPQWLPVVLPAVEVGWLLARRCWGRGYATEAGRAALRQGFGPLGLDRIISIIYPENTASLAVAGRLGLRRCGNEMHPVSGREVTIHEAFADVLPIPERGER
jgi:RimJ/RimL family protein N-acetyltransferase